MNFRLILIQYFAVLLSISLVASCVYSFRVKSKLLQDQNERVVAEMVSNFQSVISKTNVSLLTLANSVDLRDPSGQFESSSAKILKKSSWIQTLQLAPEGKILHVYPYLGNESIIGYDVMTNDVDEDLLRRSIMLKEAIVIGPLQLKQGQEAFIIRQPIFIQKTFWGFATAILPTYLVMNEIGFNKFTASKYHVKILSKKEEKVMEDSSNHSHFFMPTAFASTETRELELIFSSSYTFHLNDFYFSLVLVLLTILSFSLTITFFLKFR